MKEISTTYLAISWIVIFVVGVIVGRASKDKPTHKEVKEMQDWGNCKDEEK